MAYATYLRSRHWKELREEFIDEIAFATCFICGNEPPEQYLQLHHIDYSRIGHEEIEDLVLLCTWCHKKLHKRVKNRTSQLVEAHLDMKREDEADYGPRLDYIPIDWLDHMERQFVRKMRKLCPVPQSLLELK